MNVGNVSMNCQSIRKMAALGVGAAMLASPAALVAQRGGGRGSPGANGGSRPTICVYDCHNLSTEVDLTGKDLKTFEHLVEVEATAEQSAAFASILQDTQAATAQVKGFRELLEKDPSPPEPPDLGASLDQVLEKVRAGNQHFLAALSTAQKSGLKDIIAKLVNADSDLGKQIKVLDEIVAAARGSREVAGSLANLDKALAGFRGEQLALGREMSVLPAEGQDLTFHLPEVTSSIEIGGDSVSVPAGGTATRTSMANGINVFNLRLVANLSDLQDDITDIFRSRLNRVPPCGEHIEVQQAMLLPQSAASLAVIHLHHERWLCAPGGSLEGAERLMTESDATIEIQLRPSIGPDGQLALAAAIDRVDARGFLRDSLISGSLGATVSEQVAESLVSAMQKGTLLEALLPPVARQSATIEKVQFRDDGAEALSLVLDGQLRLSDEQTKQFAAQLKQRLSTQATSPQ